MSELIPIDINVMLKNADVIVVGNVQTLQSSIPSDTRWCYHVNAVEYLKGKLLPNPVVVTGGGAETPILGSGIPYVLFLKQSKMQGAANDSSALYDLVDNWKGAIPLSSMAKDRRTIDMVDRHFGVDIGKMTDGFIKALGYALHQNDIATVRQALHIFTIIGKKLTPLVEKAEIVVTAKVKKVDEPYEVLGRWFYKLTALKSIKGTIEEKHYLEIIYNIDSHWGLEPDPEADIPFVLFLQSIEAEIDAPQDFVYYHLVDHWKGLVALDENSKEQRASDEIMSSLGINPRKMSQSFMMSLQFCADTALFHEANDAVFIYDALKLKYQTN